MSTDYQSGDYKGGFIHGVFACLCVLAAIHSCGSACGAW